MQRIVRIVVIVMVVAASGGIIAWRLGQNNGAETTLRTATVQRSDLVATLSATGTVEPEEVIDAGARVAGPVRAFGTDKNGKSIDYGSMVEQGSVLAQIDDALYRADVEAATGATAAGPGQCEQCQRQRDPDAGQTGASPAGLGAGSETRTFRSAGAQRI